GTPRTRVEAAASRTWSPPAAPACSTASPSIDVPRAGRRSPSHGTLRKILLFLGRRRVALWRYDLHVVQRLEVTVVDLCRDLIAGLHTVDDIRLVDAVRHR